jgi:hypothetical protein
VIRKACELDSEAVELAEICLKEYPRPEKLSAELMPILKTLKVVVRDSKYYKLKELLKAHQWREADEETYRLMITTVGKEKGQWFNFDDLKNFPYEDLRTLDQLWVNYSNGKFGFSIQKRIWQTCGDSTSSRETWRRFCIAVGWQNSDATAFVKYNDLQFSIENSPIGELPIGGKRTILREYIVDSLFSRTDL